MSTVVVSIVIFAARLHRKQVLPGHGRRAHFSTDEMFYRLQECIARMKRAG